VGSHLNNWINNPGNKLRDTFKKSVPYGILRIEITYTLDNTDNKTPPTIKQVSEDMEYVKSLLEMAPKDTYFYCSINNQYKRLIEQVKQNVIVYNITTKTLLFCRWFNSLTNKINGFWKDKITKTDFILTLNQYTFNRPFKLILMESYDEIKTSTEIYQKGANKGQLKADIKTNKIKLNFRLYQKEGLATNEHTYLTDNGLWQGINDKGKNKRTNTPEEMGIAPHNGIIWKVAPTNREKSLKTYIYILH
jgi:hypothetical protein